MDLIEKQTPTADSSTESREAPAVQEKVSIVDGMAKLQSLDNNLFSTG